MSLEDNQIPKLSVVNSAFAVKSLCMRYFSIVVIKHQGNLQKEGVLWGFSFHRVRSS